MGVAALTSRLSGKKHSEIISLRSSQTGAAFQERMWQSQNSAVESSLKSATVDNMIVPAITLHAEILWTLKVATNHFLLFMLNELLRVMFSDIK